MTHAGPFLSRMLVAAGLVLAAAGAARGEGVPVDLELVLAVDISRSMDPEEQRVQREGYIAALRHPDVIAAIRSNPYGRIALVYVEWAGHGLADVVVPWQEIDGPETAERFAAALAAAPYRTAMRTSVSGGIEFARRQFAGSGFAGLRRVIDISGDGPNNSGPPVTEARDRALADGIIINGLPLVLSRGGAYGFFDIPDLDAYYENCVIGGFGAFVIPVRAIEEFPLAVRRKMVLEIAGRPPRFVPAQYVQDARPDGYDCLVGERRWRMWLDEGGGWRAP